MSGSSKLATPAPRKKKVRMIRLRPIIGWREWVEFPEFGNARIKAKIDTGARTSSLHARHIVVSEVDGKKIVTFDILASQTDHKSITYCVAPLIGRRSVKNSGGKAEERWFISTTITLGGQTWPIQVSLARRDQMGFRMLLGRQAILGKFLIDPARSFLMNE